MAHYSNHANLLVYSSTGISKKANFGRGKYFFQLPYSYSTILMQCSFSLFTIKIQKLLTKLSKEKGMEAVGRWRKACVRHFYWSVTSTKRKLQQVILAKFKSFQYHILNQHTNIPERLFKKCAHGVITTPRLWLTKGN